MGSFTTFPTQPQLAGAVPHTDQAETLSMTSANNNSTSLADFAGGAPTLNFQKNAAGTNLFITFIFSGFVGAAHAFEVAASVGGTDTSTKKCFRNTGSDHTHYSVAFKVTGLAAGTYLIKARIKVASDAFTVDQNDHFEIICTESF